VAAVPVGSQARSVPVVWDAGDERLLAQLAGRAAAKGLSHAGFGSVCIVLDVVLFLPVTEVAGAALAFEAQGR
jgi:hypothetical protein